ncbi:nitrate ABC transporter permease [Chamaesiphon minutus]|uniref:Nitrate ABC transporter, permease protein n=1 Tax=Chamaesiphon minutus (strain ATCC 27169 / PCC 6605) TaxID=1173020 RepID=K9ULR3_CHAP6|nr:nitrate ABC transporter permease [Chamaesiphon minutus]AFY95361.1 nitrate ABC transporter, permease protein [Chamaesiphon minutus PCC 6605]
MAASTSKPLGKQRRPTNTNPWLKQQLKKIVPPLAALSILLIIWQILCRPGSDGLPGPIQIIQGAWDPFIINPFFDNGGNSKGLAIQIWASLQRVFVGFFFSIVVGVGLGILIGSNKAVYRALDPIFQVLRTIPPLAWLPLSLAALKDNGAAAYFVIFITAVWPILINTTVGVQQIPQDYINVKRVLKLSKTTYFFKILLPAALPYIFTGLRIGIGLSWLAIIAAEMLIGGVGIGFFIWDSYNNAFLDRIIVALVYVGVVGYLLDLLVIFVGSKIVAEDRK